MLGIPEREFFGEDRELIRSSWIFLAFLSAYCWTILTKSNHRGFRHLSALSNPLPGTTGLHGTCGTCTAGGMVRRHGARRVVGVF